MRRPVETMRTRTCAGLRRFELVFVPWLVACGSEPSPPGERAAPAIAAEPVPDELPPPPPFGGDEGSLSARRLAVGDGFSCLLRDDRRVVCWGQHPGVAEPVAVSPIETLTGAVELVGEDGTVCARDGRGRVRCLSSPDHLGPPVLDVEGATSIGVLGLAVCAVRGDATLACAGLGDEQARTAATVSDALVLFSLHGRLCVTRREHALLCFDGASDWSQDIEDSAGVTRIGDVGGSPCPIAAEGRATCARERFAPPGDLVDLDGGGSHYCGLTAGGEAYCIEREFERVADHVVAIASRESHQCLLDAVGAVRCRGENDRGQSGGAPPTTDGIATVVRGLGPMVDVAVGAGRACAIDAGGALFCWSGASTLAEPVHAPPIHALAGSSFALCGLAGSGQIRCFADGELAVLRGISAGTIADGSRSLLLATTRDGTPAVLETYREEPMLRPVRSLAGATDLRVTRIPPGLCGVREGRLECVALEGEAHVPELTGVTRFFGDGTRALAITTEGGRVWGDVDFAAGGVGHIGGSRVELVRTPIAAPLLDDTTAMFFDGHITRVRSDGTVLRLGSAPDGSGWLPVIGLDGLGPFRRVAVAGPDGCALGESGEVRCWGAYARADGVPRATETWLDVALP